MFAQRGARLLAMIIGVVALPSAVALGWYSYTKDPTLRPLSLTKAALTEQAIDKPAEVVAYVQWDTKVEHQAGDAFARSLVQAFDIKNVDLRVIVTDGPDQGTSVVYQVGASQIGPFPKAAAVKGVNAAIGAFHMLEAGQPEPVAD
ncbi:hypothetical protein K3556_14920 [Aliiroseovarius sp. M344]|uniref:hypothetical protein n=1 Tax=Aliiroseovarius sp. M344 TaxID=2867010 RepID=UPI0021ADCEB0|nr:hypothetical protein [Aliiroseovarius sp. M344]UWQ14181.1 hypothetical protein K3556_14920 [Aliiroseovarius sp. M344]